jgi:IPTL-CTERM motif
MRTEEKKELLLAFAAYGTAAVRITSIPTLTDWGIMTLMALLGIGATYSLIPRSRLLRQ